MKILFYISFETKMVIWGFTGYPILDKKQRIVEYSKTHNYPEPDFTLCQDINELLSKIVPGDKIIALHLLDFHQKPSIYTIIRERAIDELWEIHLIHPEIVVKNGWTDIQRINYCMLSGSPLMMRFH
jgi:hypothetical protein